MANTVKIVALASHIFFIAIYAPFVSIASLKLLRIRFTCEYMARLSHITVITNVAILLHILVTALSFLEIGEIISFKFVYFGYAPYFLFSYSFWLRLWVYHFNVQYGYLTDNQEWKAIVDGNMEESMKEDYYFVNKRTYGSWRWLMKRFWILPFLGGVVLPFTIHISMGYTSNLWMAILYYISLFLMVILTLLPIVKMVYLIVWQFQEFNDTLYVLDEMAKLKWC